MPIQEVIFCNDHAQPSIAKCLACNLFLCFECLLEHQTLNHLIRKLTELTAQYVERLQGNIESLQERLNELQRTHQTKSHHQRLAQGFEMLEMCKCEILELVEKHFEQLKEQFAVVMHAANSQSAGKQTEHFISEKIEEYKQLVEELQKSVYRFSSIQPGYIQDDLNAVLQTVEKKEEEAIKFKPKELIVPRMELNEAALQQLSDSLSQLIGFQMPKEATKLLRIDVRLHAKDRAAPLLCSFVETTSLLLTYDPLEKKASRIQFRDFVCPLKARTLVTPAGKIVVIGGEKPQTDGSIRYSRQLNVLDSKFCMMKITALMKEGRVHHSAVGIQDGSRQSIFILGGKNQKRLDSLERFDLWSNSVAQLKPFRAVLGGQTGVHLSNKLYYFGGMIENELNKQILMYDIASDMWFSTTPFNSLNYLPSIEPLVLPINSDNIYIFGGVRKESSASLLSSSHAVHHYSISKNCFLMTFPEQASCSAYSIGSSCELVQGVFYMLAGRRIDNALVGPSLPQVLKVDCEKWRIWTDAFFEA